MLALGSDLELPEEPRFKIEEMEDDDWVRRVQDSFQPINFERVSITFPWRNDPVRKNVVTIVLEPGTAFGTGEHATTG